MEVPSEILAIMPCVYDFLDVDGYELLAAANFSSDIINDTSIFASVLLDPSTSGTNPSSSHQSSHKESSKTSSDITSIWSEDFRQNFRMHQTTFWELLSSLKNQSSISNDVKETKGKKKENQNMDNNILITLHYLGTQKCIQEIGEIFHVTETDVWTSIKIAIDSLYRLMQNFIVWPDHEREKQRIREGFEHICKLPDVVGVINSTHVECMGGGGSGHIDNGVFLNSNGKPSIILQAVCDHEMRFLHCSTGWPGTLNDTSVLHDSDLYHDVTEKHSSYFPRDAVLIGGNGYPLYQWLITPFAVKEALQPSDLELRFNFCHSLALDTLTKAFLHLKRRFPRLECLDVINHEQLVKTVLVSCALHNLCINQSDNAVFKEFNAVESNNAGIKTFVSGMSGSDKIISDEGLYRRQKLMKNLISSDA